MKKDIDCLLIGHNEMDFAEYEKHIRHMGVNSGAYRDLNLNFIRYNNRPYPLADIYNMLYRSEAFPGEESRQGVSMTEPLSIGENFGASIAYLATYLRRRNFTFDFVNSFRDQKNELKEMLTTANILAVAITTTLYVSAFPILEIIDFIRKYNDGVKIIVGGPYISTQVRSQAPEALKYLFQSTLGADFYVNSSQGEAALVKILDALKHGLPFHNIDNIFYKAGASDEYLASPVSPERNVLAENMVDWSLFVDRAGEYVNVRTSISCPFSCSFCGFPQRAGKYQTANVDAVERELKGLARIRSVKCVHFIDDTFNIPGKRFKEILRMMIKNRFNFKWHSYFRCQFADKEMVELMKESGCEGVFLGIESGSDHILKNMNKKTDAAKYLRGIELLKSCGIVTFGNFIIGFPGETQETVRDTVDFIEKSGLDFYRTQLWYCEPVTPIWKEKDKYQITGESFEWSHKTMNSRQAGDLIDEIFLSPRASIWVPQYNFDFDSFWHLIHRGMSVYRAGNFLKSFNDGIREKLTDPRKKEAGYEIMKRLKETCYPGFSSEDSADNESRNIKKEPADLEMEFEF